MALDTDLAVAYLKAIIEQAPDAMGQDTTFYPWLGQAGAILRASLGTNHAVVLQFQEITYDSPKDGPDTARIYRRRGTVRALGCLESALVEMQLRPYSGDVTGAAPEPRYAADGPVFVVHGHDELVREQVARLIERTTGREAVILHELPSGGNTIIEKLEENAIRASFAVVIGTPDDVGRALAAPETDLIPRPRQNVVFELGFFYGLIGRPRTVLLHTPTLAVMTDIDGIVRVPLDDEGAWKQKVAREMELAGLPVDYSRIPN